ncbi:hypothetical protein C8F04DRAFT_1329961 [Mycena alexandri]|uniref:Uncharacterized protein n=1 Tax=Mycena alexandri TaxID=1745969 RepID=A0AAD6T0R9_9AGAR|nr:hypothetical protein C8F04DRAFT_1329961 [Mycena alexandri]
MMPRIRWSVPHSHAESDSLAAPLGRRYSTSKVEKKKQCLQYDSAVFYFHGKSPAVDGVTISGSVERDNELQTMQQLRQPVSGKLRWPPPIETIMTEREVALLVSGRKELMSTSCASTGICMVNISYLGKSVYLTDDPDCAGVLLSEGEFYSKQIGENHPLFPLKITLPNGLFIKDTSNPTWSTSHIFMMTAMGAKAMRNHYVRTMDHTAGHLVQRFNEFLESGQSFDGFPWALRTAAQTTGEVAIGIDSKMLDSCGSVSQPPPLQARKLCASLDKEITPDELSKLEYLDWFIKEMQRLYNPALVRPRKVDFLNFNGLLTLTMPTDVAMAGGFVVSKPRRFDLDRWGTEEMLNAEMRSGNDSRFAGTDFCVFGAGNTQWGPTYQAFMRALFLKTSP